MQPEEERKRGRDRREGEEKRRRGGEEEEGVWKRRRKDGGEGGKEDKVGSSPTLEEGEKREGENVQGACTGKGKRSLR